MAIEAHREREARRLANLVANAPPTSATYSFQHSEGEMGSHGSTTLTGFKVAEQGYDFEHPSLRTLPRYVKAPGPFHGARPDTYTKANSHFELIDLLNRADEELLMDIENLRRDRKETLLKLPVVEKYFPPEVYRKICSYPDCLRGFNAIHKLEVTAMPTRHSLIVMSLTDDGAQPEKSQEIDQPAQSSRLTNRYSNGNSNSNGNCDVENDSASSDSTTPPVQETRHPTTPVGGLRRRSSAPSLATPRGFDSPSFSLQAPVDRRLAVDSPAAPRPSPALSNDAGEGLGHLAQLTQRLEGAAGRADSTGVVPQSRFASPADWQGKHSCCGQDLDMILKQM
jgi:hypothetical protein